MILVFLIRFVLFFRGKIPIKSFKKEDSVFILPEFNDLGKYKMAEDENETENEAAPEEPASTESDDSAEASEPAAEPAAESAEDEE